MVVTVLKLGFKIGGVSGFEVLPEFEKFAHACPEFLLLNEILGFVAFVMNRGGEYDGVRNSGFCCLCLKSCW